MEPNMKELRSKRTRITFTPRQRFALRRLYRATKYPSDEERHHLADTYGIAYSSVVSWFQNRRTEERKRSKQKAGKSLETREYDSDPGMLSPSYIAKSSRSLRLNRGNQETSQETAHQKESKAEEKPQRSGKEFKSEEEPQTNDTTEEIQIDKKAPEAEEETQKCRIYSKTNAQHSRKEAKTEAQKSRKEVMTEEKTQKSGKAPKITEQSQMGQKEPETEEGTQLPREDLESSEANKPRRTRITFSRCQLSAMERLYRKNTHPPHPELGLLARKIGVGYLNVQFWFKNRRLKAKRLERQSTSCNRSEEEYEDPDAAMNRMNHTDRMNEVRDERLENITSIGPQSQSQSQASLQRPDIQGHQTFAIPDATVYISNLSTPHPHVVIVPKSSTVLNFPPPQQSQPQTTADTKSNIPNCVETNQTVHNGFAAPSNFWYANSEMHPIFLPTSDTAPKFQPTGPMMSPHVVPTGDSAHPTVQAVSLTRPGHFATGLNNHPIQQVCSTVRPLSIPNGTILRPNLQTCTVKRSNYAQQTRFEVPPSASSTYPKLLPSESNIKPTTAPNMGSIAVPTDSCAAQAGSNTSLNLNASPGVGTGHPATSIKRENFQPSTNPAFSTAREFSTNQQPVHQYPPRHAINTRSTLKTGSDQQLKLLPNKLATGLNEIQTTSKAPQQPTSEAQSNIGSNIRPTHQQAVPHWQPILPKPISSTNEAPGIGASGTRSKSRSGAGVASGSNTLPKIQASSCSANTRLKHTPVAQAFLNGPSVPPHVQQTAQPSSSSANIQPSQPIAEGPPQVFPTGPCIFANLHPTIQPSSPNAPVPLNHPAITPGAHQTFPNGPNFPANFQPWPTNQNTLQGSPYPNQFYPQGSMFYPFPVVTPRPPSTPSRCVNVEQVPGGHYPNPSCTCPTCQHVFRTLYTQ